LSNAFHSIQKLCLVVKNSHKGCFCFVIMDILATLMGMNVRRLCFVVEIPTPDAMNEQRLCFVVEISTPVVVDAQGLCFMVAILTPDARASGSSVLMPALTV
jgi:hypothetical protein